MLYVYMNYNEYINYNLYILYKSYKIIISSENTCRRQGHSNNGTMCPSLVGPTTAKG